MPASRIAVIYGAQSRLIHMVVRADTDAELARAIAGMPIAESQAVLELAANAVAGMDAAQFRAHVAAQIGEPLTDGRAVAIDATGVVRAAVAADLLSFPDARLGGLPLEAHPWAQPGDMRIGERMYSEYRPGDDAAAVAALADEIARDWPRTLTPEQEQFKARLNASMSRRLADLAAAEADRVSREGGTR